MFCKNCGTSIPDDSNFCLNCGAKADKPIIPKDPPPKIISPTIPTTKNTSSHTFSIFLTIIVCACIVGFIIQKSSVPVTVNKQPVATQPQKSPEEIAAEKKAAEEKSLAEKKAHEEAIKPPVTLSKLIAEPNVIGEPTISLIMTNNSPKVIDAFKVNIYCYDNYDKQLKQFGAGDPYYSGISQREIAPDANTSSNYSWTLHGFENGRKFKLKLISIHFSDGTTWTAEQGQDVSISIKT